MSFVTLSTIETAAVEHLSISSDATLVALHRRLAAQSKATRNHGIAFNRDYFVATASLARAAAKQLDVTMDEALDLFARQTVMACWMEATKFLQREMELIRNQQGTIAVAGGAQAAVLTQFRRDLRFIADECGTSLRRTKRAIENARELANV